MNLYLNHRQSELGPISREFDVEKLIRVDQLPVSSLRKILLLASDLRLGNRWYRLKVSEDVH